MPKCMQHWNGNQLCAIDIETSGLDPHWHEILQIAILPLDSNIQPRKDVLPFYIKMIPYHPERADEKALRVSSVKLPDATLNGFDQEAAKDLLEEWVDKLGLPMRKGGWTQCQIMPLVQNGLHDIPFIKRWLGLELYEQFFHPHVRDTMIAALFANDVAGMHVEKIPYPKVNLSYLCSQLKFKRHRAHDALQDCLATAEVYRRMISQGFLA